MCSSQKGLSDMIKQAAVLSMRRAECTMTSWTGHQPIPEPAQIDTDWVTFTPKGNLEYTVHLTCMLLEWNCVFAKTQGDHANSTGRGPKFKQLLFYGNKTAEWNTVLPFLLTWEPRRIQNEFLNPLKFKKLAFLHRKILNDFPSFCPQLQICSHLTI